MFASSGASVVLSDVNANELDEAVSSVAALGSPAVGITCDVTCGDQIRHLVKSAKKRFAKIDILVMCAGIMHTGDLATLDEKDWRRVIDINLTGSFLAVKEVGSTLVEQGSGAIVLFSSVAGRGGRPHAAHYSASKAGILSLTKSAAMAFAPKVSVNAVCPGVFLTPMWDHIMEEHEQLEGAGGGKRYLEKATAGCLLQRTGDPKELAAAVAFFASDAASYITGQALNVDGGIEMD